MRLSPRIYQAGSDATCFMTVKSNSLFEPRDSIFSGGSKHEISSFIDCCIQTKSLCTGILGCASRRIDRRASRRAGYTTFRTVQQRERHCVGDRRCGGNESARNSPVSQGVDAMRQRRLRVLVPRNCERCCLWCWWFTLRLPDPSQQAGQRDVQHSHFLRRRSCSRENQGLLHFKYALPSCHPDPSTFQ